MSGMPGPDLPQPDLSRLGADEYTVPKPRGPIDLWLHGNEGPPPGSAVTQVANRLGDAPELLRRYPNPRLFEAALAERHDVDVDRVLVTAGADEAIDRFCRAFLSPAQNVVVLTPAFEMVERYVQLTGAAIREVPWVDATFPVDAILDAIDTDTVAVMFATPSNPTGLAAPIEAIEELAARAPQVWLLLDLVYAEFLEADPMTRCLALPNGIALRSLSKSGGLAGLRVGYAVGPESAIAALRRAGGPYSVAGPSLALAAAALDEPPETFAAFARCVATERAALRATLRECGAEVLPSSANFVLARAPRARWLFEGLAGLGIGVRWFGTRRGLSDAVRISCPGDAVQFERLLDAIRATLVPEAILFDMDGVLVDVRESYDRAIIETAATYGVAVTPADIAEGKAQGDANSDWELTRRLLEARGVDATLEEVTERFEALYLERLCHQEAPTVAPSFLAALAARFPLGIVTGRPRRDAERFLQQHDLTRFFGAVVCMEDAARKPDPAPMRVALARLGVSRAWLLGDTVDDVRAARAAGVVPIGVVAPGSDPDVEDRVLATAGASRVLGALTELEPLVTEIP